MPSGEHDALLHVPSGPPHAEPFAWHLPSTQHARTLLQALLWQHAAPFAPHAIGVPERHTCPAEVFCPEAKHVPPLQQPPPPHAFPAQHGSPGTPHATHVLPPPQTLPAPHVLPAQHV